MLLSSISNGSATIDAVPILLAMLLAAGALYLGNIIGGIAGAIADEHAGLKEPLCRQRSFASQARNPEFVLLLVTAASAAQGVAWWISLPLCLAGLSTARLPKYLRLWPRAVEIEQEGQVFLAVSGSTALSLVSATTMITVGACAGWLLR